MISMILSLIILILSDTRPLVEVEINGRPAVMLVDTGSSTEERTVHGKLSNQDLQLTHWIYHLCLMK